MNLKRARTGIIPQNRSFHDSLHPITNNTLLLRAKIMCLVMVMIDPEPISSRVNILINCDFISNDVDISLDSSFLQNKTEKTKLLFNQKTIEGRNSLIYRYSSGNTNAVL